MSVLSNTGFDKSFEVQFKKDGGVNDPNELQAAIDGLKSGSAPTDIIVMSHGWNNDLNDARQLYANMFTCMKGFMNKKPLAGLAGRTFGIIGVLWPSKKFTDSDLIAGGAAAADDIIGDEAIKDRLESLKGFFDKPDNDALDRAKNVVKDLDNDPAARAEYVKQLQSVLRPPTDTKDDPASPIFLQTTGDAERIELFESLSAPIRAVPVTDDAAQGGIASVNDDAMPVGGGSAGLGELFSGMKAAAQRLLNFVTFYQMKERAGTVGAGGVSKMLQQLRQQFPNVRLHLIGHSFGGRLVTAAANGPATTGINSMSLLQAAFSHNGFSTQASGRPVGFFRDVLAGKKISGPVLITYTVNDKAVGLAYPLAARLANEQGRGLGDANDAFGGLGRNGAVNLTDNDTPIPGDLPLAPSFTFQPGKFHNLHADAIIKDHSDIVHDEVVEAILSAIAKT